MVGLSVPDKRPAGRRILPRTCDIPRPTARPASAALLPTAFDAHGRSAGAGVVLPSPAPATVSKSRAATWNEVWPDRLRSGHLGLVVPASGAGSDRPRRRKFGQVGLRNI